MTDEFWQALEFALECGVPRYEDPGDHFKRMDQCKYSYDDITLILIPVLGRFDFTVPPHPYITKLGEQALEVIHAGGRPVLKHDDHAELTMEEIRKRVTRRADNNGEDVNKEDQFSSDPEGFFQFAKAMLDLDLFSNYQSFPIYLWTQVLSILKGENPPVQDILMPFLQGVTNKPKLAEFLERQLAKDEDEFNDWEEYASHICYVL